MLSRPRILKFAGENWQLDYTWDTTFLEKLTACCLDFEVFAPFDMKIQSP